FWFEVLSFFGSAGSSSNHHVLRYTVFRIIVVQPNLRETRLAHDIGLQEELVARTVAAAGEIAEDQAMIRKTVYRRTWWFELEPALPKKEGSSNQNCN
ncbi:Hypothetical predicted protein, partial [Olea europaea subsp. europaea]